MRVSFGPLQPLDGCERARAEVLFASVAPRIGSRGPSLGGVPPFGLRDALQRCALASQDQAERNDDDEHVAQAVEVEVDDRALRGDLLLEADLGVGARGREQRDDAGC